MLVPVMAYAIAVVNSQGFFFTSFPFISHEVNKTDRN